MTIFIIIIIINGNHCSLCLRYIYHLVWLYLFLSKLFFLFLLTRLGQLFLDKMFEFNIFSRLFFPVILLHFSLIDDDDQSESNVTQTKKKQSNISKYRLFRSTFRMNLNFDCFFLFPVVVVVNLDCNLSSSSSSIVIWSTNVQLLLMMMMMMFQCLNITLMMMIILMLVAYNNNNNKVVTACVFI